MRLPLALLVSAAALPLLGAEPAPSAQPVTTIPGASALSRPDCLRTTTYLTDGGLFRGAPLKLQKLTELPPAIGYMAVVRRIGPCEVPLTMVEYRERGR